MHPNEDSQDPNNQPVTEQTEAPEPPVFSAPAEQPSSDESEPQPAMVVSDPTPAASEPAWQPAAATLNYVEQAPETSIAMNPQPVVNVLSPRGVEYVFLTISLFTAAIGLTGALLVLVNGAASFSSLSFPTALMVVGLPLFALLFLRLKKAELLEPSAALDASKRRSTQTTQIICFLVVLFSLIGLITALMAKVGGNLGVSISSVLLDVLVLIVVFGGILAYYWHDEHRR